MNKINWFPGHMSQSLKMLVDEVRQCDVIIYVLDARCPKSCLNPEFIKLTDRKPVVYALNKSDLAPRTDFHGVSIVSTQSNSLKKLLAEIKMATRERVAAKSAYGIIKTVRAMVIGVPNCGKSTLINNLARDGKTKTENRPGVTRTKQWVAAGDHLMLLDTPGVLYPNLENTRIAKNLAYIGAIKDDILDIVELAADLLADIGHNQTLEEFCRANGCVLSGGRVDELRGARMVLSKFRSGGFGRFNLDNLL